MQASPLVKIFDGDTLVGLELDCEVATKPQPDLFEREIKRVFDEYIRLRAENTLWRVTAKADKKAIKQLETENANLVREIMVANNNEIVLKADYAHAKVAEIKAKQDWMATAIMLGQAEESIRYAIGGIDALFPHLGETLTVQQDKDILAIKETLEQALKGI